VTADGTRDGRVIFQCKRISGDGKFGPSKVEEVVRAAADLAADKRVLVLSRVASPQARQAAQRNGWDIWDYDDIVQALQTGVSLEHARRIVRTFFPGYASDFLGLASFGPWLSLDEMYAGQLEEGQLFTHVWSLAGRDSEVAAAIDWLQSPDDSRKLCHLVVGSAGIGKSRLLIEVARLVPDETEVWFVDSNAEVRPEDFESLDQGPLLIVIDDAHDRQDLETILRGALARNARVRTRVLLATRPHGEGLVVRAVSSLLGGAIPSSTTLSRLERSDAKQLAAQVLGIPSDSTYVHEVVRVAGDSTMLTVATALMFKQKRINPALMTGADEVRRVVLEAWVDQHSRALTDLPAGIQARPLMQALAAVQPLELVNTEHLSAFGTLLGTERHDHATQSVERAVAAGVAIKRAGRIRIVPDMLADYVLAEACYSVSLARATGFADWAWQAAPALRRSLLVNLSRVDWQLEASGTATASLIDTAWSSLVADFRSGGIQDRSALLSMVAEIAYYQPRRSLELARWAIDNSIDDVETGFFGQALTYAEVLQAIPKVLRYCAFHMEYLDESLDLLWALAKGDRRPTNQYPDHPLRVLTELASYSLLKPFGYSRRVIKRALRWLEREPNPAVFAVLSEAVKWDAKDHIAEGITINMRSYSSLRVAPEPQVLALRRRVVKALVTSLRSTNPGIGVAAVQAIRDALRKPGGLFGRIADDYEIEVWTQEATLLLRELCSDDALVGVGSLVKAELLGLVEGLVDRSSDAVTEAAVELQNAIGTDLDVEVAEALRYGPWRRELRKPGGGSGESERRWLKDIAERLVAREKTPEAVAEYLERALEQVSVVEGGRAQPGPLVAALVEAGSGVARSIADRVSAEPQSRLSAVVGAALSFARRDHADDVLQIAQELLAAGDVELRRQIAYAYGWGLGSAPAISEEEMRLIHELARDDDLLVARNVAGGLRFVAAIDPAAAIDVLLELRIGRTPDLADDTLVLFNKGEGLSLDLLDAESLQAIVDELLLCPSIDQHWVGQFLGILCQRDLPGVVELLKGRVEAAEQHEYSYDEYRALPFGWEDRTPLSTLGHPERLKVLRDVIDWATCDVAGWRREFESPRLFAMVTGSFDEEALALLEETLAEEPLPKAKRSAHLLSETPKAIIWENVPWTSRVLESALARDASLYRALVSALWAAVVAGGKSGTPGKPYPQDIEQRDRARAIADSLPRGSAAEQFYRNLQRSAESEIARKAEDDEELS